MIALHPKTLLLPPALTLTHDVFDIFVAQDDRLLFLRRIQYTRTCIRSDPGERNKSQSCMILMTDSLASIQGVFMRGTGERSRKPEWLEAAGGERELQKSHETRRQSCDGEEKYESEK